MAGGGREELLNEANAPCALIRRALAVNAAASPAERLRTAGARSSIALVTRRKRTRLYVPVPLSATLLPTVSLVEASKRVSGLTE